MKKFKKWYPAFERATYHPEKRLTHKVKRFLLRRYNLHPKFAFWFVFSCFISLAAISILTYSYQTYENGHIFKPKMSKEKEVEKQKVDNLKIYFKHYMMKNFNLYDRYTDYVADCILKESKLKDLDPILVISIIEVESSFMFNAKSDKNSYGLMQVNYTVWKHKTKELGDLYDPATNIKIGTDILQQYVRDNNGDIKKALDSYLGTQSEDYEGKVLKVMGNHYLLLRKNV